MSEDRPMDRRRFFREGLRELLRPVSRAVEPIQRVANELGNLEPSPLPSLPPPVAPAPGSGIACWYEHLCVRTHGEPCTMCVDHCPNGPAALEVVDDRITVHESGCTACGACQENCPTDPKSIVVVPRTVGGG